MFKPLARQRAKICRYSIAIALPSV